ncbi:MAG: Holliday junction branch migration DNA helicase RuvB [Firmicutes bacterium]|nr:Holliday junction branch migration DNA helicase RuvB [Bacillota bacterium]
MEDREDRVVNGEFAEEDLDIERSLRPKRLNEFIGQKNVTKNLETFIEAALQRKESLDHVVFYGPPGLGKTTLAGIIASELGVDFRITSGPAIEKAGDLAAVLTNLNEGDVLFIDEIHRLHKTVEEMLYSAMEDFALDIIIGKGPSARTLRVDLNKFTLVGATTRLGNLTGPLRDRFGIISQFQLYTTEELMQIIRRSANLLGVQIDQESMAELAKRSRGTPRIANRLLRRIRDFAQVRGNGSIDIDITRQSLADLRIDDLGLEELDRQVLRAIITQFKGGPVGINAIASAVGEEKITIEDAYEPYLIQSGLLFRTQKGRIASELAYRHLGLENLLDKNGPSDDQVRMEL